LLAYGRFDGYVPAAGGDSFVCFGGEVRDVFSDAEVEEELAVGGMLDEKGIGRAVESVEAFNLGGDEWSGGDAADGGGCVDYTDFDGGAGGRGCEGGWLRHFGVFNLYLQVIVLRRRKMMRRKNDFCNAACAIVWNEGVGI
jgi:hypothetical protein